MCIQTEHVFIHATLVGILIQNALLLSHYEVRGRDKANTPTNTQFIIFLLGLLHKKFSLAQSNRGRSYRELRLICSE